ncbi:MAG: ribosome biogenesis GTPase YlqF [Clostridia bacterium]
MVIHWYPGHMTKTKRMIEANIKHVDVVCEIIDARIPKVSRNPDIDWLTAGKPRLIILNRIDLADDFATKKWIEYFKNQGFAVITTDSKSGAGVNKFSKAINELLAEKISSWKEKGQIGKTAKAMIVGIPNVGKSSFINKVLKKRSALASDKPGVTRGKQWFKVDDGVELLDTPGILWPKLDDEHTGILLAVTGAVKDDILDIETLACKLLEMLAVSNPQVLIDRYKIDPHMEVDFLGYELLMDLAKKRGFLMRGAEADTLRASKILLDEYRGGVLGKLTLEMPEE